MHKALLIVDDSRTIRMALTREVKKIIPEIDVMECADGKEAVHAMTQNTICAIITDLEMPNMDGNELVEKLKKNALLHKKVMIIFTSKPEEVKPELRKLSGVMVFDKNKPDSMRQIVETIVKVREQN